MLRVQPSIFTATLTIYVILNASQWSQAQESWLRFRGDHGTGVVADDPRLPEEWSAEKNVKWRTEIPGRGWGSPVILGQKVFLTAVTSDDAYEAPQAGLYFVCDGIHGPQCRRHRREGSGMKMVREGS